MNTFQVGDLVTNVRRIEFFDDRTHEPHTIHLVTVDTLEYFNVNVKDYIKIEEIKVEGRTFAMPNHDYGYTENYIRSYMELKGVYKYDLFLEWMSGQTVSSIRGEKIFYAHDVFRYLTKGGVNAKVID